MTEPADLNVDELRRRARRRLVGAVVLALAVAVIVPMLLETEQKPLGEDVSVKIPPVDNDKFVNRISESRSKDEAPVERKDDAGKAAAPPSERPPKYDTRLPEAAPATEAAPANAAAPASERSANAPPPATATNAAAPAVAAAAAPVEAAKPAVTISPVPAAPATASVPSATKTAEPPHEGYAVQLAAFADDKGANALAGRLKKAGYATYTEPLKTSKGTLWRVRVGPYSSREAALAARDKLKTEGHSGIVAAAH